MKKRIAVILTLLLVLSGCGGQQAQPTAPTQPSGTTGTPAAPSTGSTQPTQHIHSPVTWASDCFDHWYLCSCGETMGLGKHEFREENLCAVCGSHVFQYEDGSYSVFSYDANGALIRNTDYAQDGTVLYDMYVEIEYAEDGSARFAREYMDGVLTSESAFLPADDPTLGEVYLAESTTYYEDGDREICTFDQWNNLLTVRYVESDGTVTQDEEYRYQFDDQGNCLCQSTYISGKLYRQIFYKLDSEGIAYEARHVLYDEGGNITREVCYDQYGNEIV